MNKDKSKESQIEKVVINLSEATNHNLSDFVNTVKYIQLKTPPTETIGKGVLKIMEKYIYFHDYQQQCLFVFDREGNFVAKLDKLGNGPDEYLKLNGFFVNNNEREIEIWDNSRDKILTYQNVTFDLLKEKKLKDDITFNSALRIDNNQYLLSTNGNRN